jgi:hypothetical protein
MRLRVTRPVRLRLQLKCGIRSIPPFGSASSRAIREVFAGLSSGTKVFRSSLKEKEQRRKRQAARDEVQRVVRHRRIHT